MPDGIFGSKVLDWREQQKVGGPDPKCGKRLSNGRLLLRDAKSITGITVHQTDCLLPPGHRPDRHLRALEVHAHATVFTDGVGVLAYPLRAYVYHGNGANSSRIGIEIEGVLPGIGVGKVPDAQIEAAKATIKYIIAEAEKEGITILEIDAHRQWSGDRRGDPGQELWQRLVVEWAVPELGLRCDYGYFDPTHKNKKGQPSPGMPIPTDWDPNGIGRY